MTTRQLLGWMFSFLRPVKGNVFLACLWLALLLRPKCWRCARAVLP